MKQELLQMLDYISNLVERWFTHRSIFTIAKIVCLRHHTSHEVVSKSLLLSILKTFLLHATYSPYHKIKIINLILLGLVKLFHDLHFQFLFTLRAFLILLSLLTYALDEFQLLAY